MKNLFIYSFIYLTSIILPKISMGQNIHIDEVGGYNSHCPGEEVHYAIYFSSSYNVVAITNTKWKVTGGTITNKGDTNDLDCKVIWNDTIAGKLEIETVCLEIDPQYGENYITCANNVGLVVKIKSINDVTPVFVNPNTAIDLNDNTSIIYDIGNVIYGDDNWASEYKWNIPEGWISNGVTSTGNNTYTTAYSNITVIPDDCSSGELKVWATNTRCSGKSNSDTTILTINRKYPDFVITGSNELCSTGTYSINTTTDFSISWIPCTGMNIVSGQGTNQITVSKASNNDNCLLKAIVSYNPCTINSQTFTKSVNIGEPDVDKMDISLDGGYLLACDYTSGEADYNGTAGIDAYDWYMPDAYDWVIEEESGAGPDNKYVEIEYWDDPPSYQEAIYVRAHNQCGWSYWAYENFSVINNCGGYYMMNMYPNPADSYVELIFIDDSTSSLDEELKENKIKIRKKNNIAEDDILIEILDKDARVRKSVQTNNLNVNIPTKDLEAGTYFMHVTIGHETYKQQLIIQ